jgi:RNA-binding protein Nova
MSKANDFYPGTNERVCLVTGDREAVTEVMGFLTEKVKEKPDPNSKTAIDFDSKVTAERDKQIKVTI